VITVLTPAITDGELHLAAQPIGGDSTLGYFETQLSSLVTLSEVVVAWDSWAACMAPTVLRRE